MTKAERRRLEEKAQLLRNRGHGMRDELYLWMAELFEDLISRTAKAEQRILTLEHRSNRRQVDV